MHLEEQRADTKNYGEVPNPDNWWEVNGCNMEVRISCWIGGRRWKGMMHWFLNTVKLAARSHTLLNVSQQLKTKDRSLERAWSVVAYLAIKWCKRGGQREETRSQWQNQNLLSRDWEKKIGPCDEVRECTIQGRRKGQQEINYEIWEKHFNLVMKVIVMF